MHYSLEKIFACKALIADSRAIVSFITYYATLGEYVCNGFECGNKAQSNEITDFCAQLFGIAARYNREQQQIQQQQQQQSAMESPYAAQGIRMLARPVSLVDPPAEPVRARLTTVSNPGATQSSDPALHASSGVPLRAYSSASEVVSPQGLPARTYSNVSPLRPWSQHPPSRPVAADDSPPNQGQRIARPAHQAPPVAQSWTRPARELEALGDLAKSDADEHPARTVRCNVCSSEVDELSKFCGECGAQVTHASDADLLTPLSGRSVNGSSNNSPRTSTSRLSALRTDTAGSDHNGGSPLAEPTEPRPLNPFLEESELDESGAPGIDINPFAAPAQDTAAHETSHAQEASETSEVEESEDEFDAEEGVRL